MTNRLQVSGNSRDHKHTHGHQDSCDVEEADEGFEEIKPAIIFDAAYLGESVPPKFDAVCLKIDGTIRSNLSWAKEIEVARRYVEQGLRLFWEIDLGLFDRLERPLSDQGQFQSLALSLEHFRDSVWKQFRHETIGLSIYRGNLDFSEGYPWDPDQQVSALQYDSISIGNIQMTPNRPTRGVFSKFNLDLSISPHCNLQEWLKESFGTIAEFVEETKCDGIAEWQDIVPGVLQHTLVGTELLRLFCRDACGEYLDLLSARLPDSLPLFVFFDASSLSDPYLVALLLTKERYPRIHIGVKEPFCSHKQSLGGEIAWEGPPLALGMLSREMTPTELAPRERSRLALCLPKLNVRRTIKHDQLRGKLSTLLQNEVPFRVIPEVLLSSEWDALDDLIVDADNIDQPLRRKLEGFSAAGGVVHF